MYYLRLNDDEVKTIISALCEQIDTKEALHDMYRREAAKLADKLVESKATLPQDTSEVTEGA